jgi:WD40 repeat protein
MLLLKGHKQPVTGLAVSPDGRRLASATGSRAVWLWDLATGKVVDRLRPGYSDVQSVAFSPRGGLLASAEVTGRVRLTDVATTRFAGFLGAFRVRFTPRLAFRGDGAVLAATVFHLEGWSPTDECRLLLWDVARAKSLGPVAGVDARSVVSLAFSPAGDKLAVGYRGGTVFLIEAASHAKVARLRAGVVPNQLLFSPDGRSLAVVAGWSVLLCDGATLRCRRALEGHRALVRGAAFSPDGGLLVTGGGDRTVRCWDVASGRERSSLRWQIGSVRALAFTPDGMRAVAGGGNGDLVVWDVEWD